MTTLVAGASKGVGRLVCSQLLKLNQSVRGVSRSGMPPMAGMEMIPGDLLNPSDCKRIVEGCHRIVCTVGAYSVSPDRDIVDGLGIIQLIDAAKEAGTEHFVLVSSLGVGDSWNTVPSAVRWFFKVTGSIPILHAKAASEKHLKANLPQWTILRPGFLTNHPMRAEPFCAEGVVPGLTTREAVADVAVRCFGSDAARKRTLAVCNRWLGRFGPREIELEATWTSWSS